jgi:hypothetical protein
MTSFLINAKAALRTERATGRSCIWGRRNIMNKLTNNTGSALLITLCLMLMLTGVAMVAVNESTTDVQLSFNQMHEEQAFYTAEAGANRAIGVLRGDRSWNAGFSNVAFSGGSYSVTITDRTINPGLLDTVIVTSRGIHDGAKAAVEISVVPDIRHPFRYAMFADEFVEIKNSAITDSYHSDSGSYVSTVMNEFGDVGSNGDIDIKAAASIGGDLSTTGGGEISLYPGATVSGDTIALAPVTEIPPIPESEFASAEASNSNLFGMSGQFRYSPASYELNVSGPVTLQSGTYYFSNVNIGNGGSIKLAPGAEVKIYMTGTFFVGNSGTVNDHGQPAGFQIFSKSDLILLNSGDFYGAFYSPEGKADLRNSGDFYGSIIANTSIVHNSSGFHYDRDLLRIERDDGTLRQLSWAEIN